MSRDSAKCRRLVVEHHSFLNPSGRKMLRCHVCDGWIDILKQPNFWRADHIRRYAEGGEDTPENLHPICMDCDAGPDGKAAADTREVAKGKRVSDKHNGVRKTKRPFPKRANAWGKDMDK